MSVIETERLTLRELTEDDATFMLALVNDPGWLRFVGDKNVHSLEEARAYLRTGPMRLYRQHGFGLYLVERKEDRAPIGICGLVKRDELDHADLGFALLPAYRSQGYASEAATGTLDYARDALGMGRLAAIVTPGNTASVRLLERLGFSFECFLRFPDGDEVNLFMLDLT